MIKIACNYEETLSENIVNIDTLLPVKIEDEMQRSYMDYAMSVIVSRALPDSRDGLKPVHRRILFSMHEMNNYSDKPYKKSARIVGDVIGKYHPHGDSPIYGALVRMAQDFSLRVPLVDGQGNFGSQDGDMPAQMRYTEVRLAKISNYMLQDLELNTVDFRDNYDGSEREPAVLPSIFPNLLVNGANGIAVGMATNIPTHNLREVCNACVAYIDNPDITQSELMEIVPAPDFPTGGIITSGIRAKIALSTGRGSIILRSRTHFEELGGRDAIVATEIPYQVNKAEMLKKIESLARNKEVEGMAEIRDESNKLGVRVVIELKKGFEKEVVLNQLFKFTQLQSSFAVNMLALDNNEPRMMNVYELIKVFIKFREEVVYRRISHLLNRARTKAHLLIGLYIAVLNIDEVIKLIKSASNPAEAKILLMKNTWSAQDVAPLLALVDDTRNILQDGRCNFTDEQAKAILDMKLSKLTALEKNKIYDELNEIAKEIENYIRILSARSEILAIIRAELLEVAEKHGTPRMTDIQQIDDDMDIEDLIQQEDMIVTLSHSGYIKRVPLATYRSQRRGGKGRTAMATNEDDFITKIISTNTHETLLFFSDLGKVYKSKVYKLPLGSPTTKGRAMINLLPLAANEKINTIIQVNDQDFASESVSIIFATAMGNIRRNSIADFASIQSNGKIAIRLEGDDKLIGVRVCSDEDHVFMTSALGKAIRFAVADLRVFKSRTSDGVRGIKLAQGDRVVFMTTLYGVEMPIEQRDEFLKIPHEVRRQLARGEEVAVESTLDRSAIESFCQKEEFILTVTENGYGKRTSAYEYRVSGRGGQGIMNIDTSTRNGKVATSFVVDENEEIMLITDGGTVLRTKVSSIRISGRNTMGVNIIKLRENEAVVSIAKIETSDEVGEEVVEGPGEESSEAVDGNA